MELDEATIQSLGYFIAATLILVVTLAVIKFSFKRIRKNVSRIEKGKRENQVWLQQVAKLINSFLGLVKLLAIIILFYFYLLYVFNLFPATQHIGETLVTTLVDFLNLVVESIIGFLPNLVILIAIAVLAVGFIKFIKPIFQALETESFKVPGFYPEWAKPTHKLIVLITLVVALLFAYPYLPGADSPAFKGLTIFMGVLVSLGSTSAVSNIIGGVILIYTRAFKDGDVVKIEDTVGVIVEKTLLVTRVRTPKNVIVTIPNATVMKGSVINYSTSPREDKPLILDTSITLGYDVEWRKVHGALIKAGLDTEHVLKEPKPFVLQKALDDHYVEYELNVSIKESEKIPTILSQLHQNIQDECSKAGIEILSPQQIQLKK